MPPNSKNVAGSTSIPPVANQLQSSVTQPNIPQAQIKAQQPSTQEQSTQQQSTQQQSTQQPSTQQQSTQQPPDPLETRKATAFARAVHHVKNLPDKEKKEEKRTDWKVITKNAAEALSAGNDAIASSASEESKSQKSKATDTANSALENYNDSDLRDEETLNKLEEKRKKHTSNMQLATSISSYATIGAAVFTLGKNIGNIRKAKKGTKTTATLDTLGSLVKSISTVLNSIFLGKAKNIEDEMDCKNLVDEQKEAEALAEKTESEQKSAKKKNNAKLTATRNMANAYNKKAQLAVLICNAASTFINGITTLIDCINMHKRYNKIQESLSINNTSNSGNSTVNKDFKDLEPVLQALSERENNSYLYMTMLAGKFASEIAYAVTFSKDPDSKSTLISKLTLAGFDAASNSSKEKYDTAKDGLTSNEGVSAATSAMFDSLKDLSTGSNYIGYNFENQSEEGQIKATSSDAEKDEAFAKYDLTEKKLSLLNVYPDNILEASSKEDLQTIISNAIGY